MQKLARSTALFGTLFLLLVVVFTHTTPAHAVASHVVLSEIQVAGADEFIELYNPTGSDLSLTKWRIMRRTVLATTSANLVASMSGTIKSHGFPSSVRKLVALQLILTSQ